MVVASAINTIIANSRGVITPMTGATSGGSMRAERLAPIGDGPAKMPAATSQCQQQVEQEVAGHGRRRRFPRTSTITSRAANACA